MEVQDFSPEHLVARLSYKQRDASVVDHRGSIANAMRRHLELPGAGMDSTGAEVQSGDERDKYRIGIAQVVASILSFDDFDAAVEDARRFFEMSLDLIDVEAFRQVTVHTSDIAPVESFDELRDALFNGLGEKLGGAKEAVGVKLSQSAWTFEFDDGDCRFAVNLGPMTGDELRDVLDDPISEYPPSLLFLDVMTQLRSREGVPADGVVEWWSKAVDRNRTVVGKLGAWLKEQVLAA